MIPSKTPFFLGFKLFNMNNGNRDNGRRTPVELERVAHIFETQKPVKTPPELEDTHIISLAEFREFEEEQLRRESEKRRLYQMAGLIYVAH